MKRIIPTRVRAAINCLRGRPTCYGLHFQAPVQIDGPVSHLMFVGNTVNGTEIAGVELEFSKSLDLPSE